MLSEVPKVERKTRFTLEHAVPPNNGIKRTPSTRGCYLFHLPIVLNQELAVHPGEW